MKGIGSHIKKNKNQWLFFLNKGERMEKSWQSFPIIFFRLMKSIEWIVQIDGCCPISSSIGQLLYISTQWIDVFESDVVMVTLSMPAIQEEEQEDTTPYNTLNKRRRGGGRGRHHSKEA